jgi:hypothetical protein
MILLFRWKVLKGKLATWIYFLDERFKGEIGFMILTFERKGFKGEMGNMIFLTKGFMRKIGNMIYFLDERF